jgi:hypothetical protein
VTCRAGTQIILNATVAATDCIQNIDMDDDGKYSYGLSGSRR